MNIYYKINRMEKELYLELIKKYILKDLMEFELFNYYYEYFFSFKKTVYKMESLRHIKKPRHPCQYNDCKRGTSNDSGLCSSHRQDVKEY